MVYTEVVQAVVLVAGALGLLFVGLYKVGGLSQLREQLPERYHHHDTMAICECVILISSFLISMLAVISTCGGRPTTLSFPGQAFCLVTPS